MNILEDLSVAVEKIVVTELRDSTFYATIELQRNGDRYEVSSRPSRDRAGRAARRADLRERGGPGRGPILIPGEEGGGREVREFLDNVTPEDFNPEGTSNP